MRFANLVLDADKDIENVGDWAQIFAIEYLYQYMNIDYRNVVRIKVSELSTYSGEYVILPINFPFYGYYNLSAKIIPVYLGISIIHKSVVSGLRMENFQPIGCRDFHTWKELTDCGLEAYMAGCLTITWPKRATSDRQNKIFIVDVSDHVYKRIPENIRKKAKRVSHIRYSDECKGEDAARNIYKAYKDEACLVITSRIHCAQPCLAMGIPVVFICDVCSFRYDVIRQYIPVYSLETMDRINWAPEVPDLETHKKMMLQNASTRIFETRKRYEGTCQLGDFYLQGEPIEHEVDSVWAFQRYLLERYEKEDEFQYSIWGITQIAEAIYEWVSNEFPNATLDRVIDRSLSKTFHGVLSEPIDSLKECRSTVFVTAGSANAMAIKIFESYGIENYVICYNGMYVVNGKEFTY